MCPEKYGLESVQVSFERAPFPQKNRPSSLPATVLFFICGLLGISQQPQTPSIPIFQMLKLKSREVRQLAMVTLLGAEEPRLNAGFSIPKSRAHCMPSHAPATTSSCISADVLLVYKVVRCICDLGLWSVSITPQSLSMLAHLTMKAVANTQVHWCRHTQGLVCFSNSQNHRIPVVREWAVALIFFFPPRI